MKHACENRHARLLATILFAVTPLALAATPLASQEEPVFSRQHTVVFLDLNGARSVVEEVCRAEERCQFRGGRSGTPGPHLDVVATAAMHEQIALALRAADVPPTPHRFQLVLLAADQSGAGLPQGLPAGVARALEDVSGFLPFNGYRLLDTGFVRAVRQASLVLSGLEGRHYEAQIAFRADTAGEHLFIDSLTLYAPPHAQAGEPVAPGVEQGSASQAGTREDVSSGPDPDRGTAARPRGVMLLTTSFPMARAETVVAGTSRLHGGEAAIVVLLTALP